MWGRISTDLLRDQRCESICNANIFDRVKKTLQTQITLISYSYFWTIKRPRTYTYIYLACLAPIMTAFKWILI